MIRHNLTGISSVFFLLILFSLTAWAQTEMSQPPDTLPPGVKREILNLKYQVEDLSGKVQSLKMKETATEVRIELAADVLFDFDKYDILSKAQEVLKQVAGVIREKAKGVVHIEGHTDSKGSAAYNQKLSERRANTVKDWLVNKEGLKNLRFETRGFGAKKPVAPNRKPDGSDDPEGRQKNRRVEIVVKKK
jgi:outer membrane protein OmpA-like peptidoglycan-associated protein